MSRRLNILETRSSNSTAKEIKKKSYIKDIAWTYPGKFHRTTLQNFGSWSRNCLSISLCLIFFYIFGNTSTWSTHPLVSFVKFPKSCRKILLLLFDTPFWPFFRRTIIRKWLSSHHLFSIFKNGFAAICASQSNFVSAPSRPKKTCLPGFSLWRRFFF